MALLPAQGTISYGGAGGPTVTFGPETKTDIESRFNYDTAGRSVSSVTYIVTVDTKLIATAGGDNETTMLTWRNVLSTPGLYFNLSGKGFANLVIDNSGGPVDVAYGPKPQILNWRNSRGNRAADVKWQVEITIPQCTNANYSRQIMEFNYTIQFSIDRSGYTTRRYSGYYVIPMSRVPLGSGNRIPTDNADYYFEQIVPTCPLGFRRTTNDRNDSEDKRKITFTIIDEEMPNALPPGVIDCQASHRASTAHRASLNTFNGVISARYELAKDTSKTAAYRYFIALCIDRLQTMYQVSQQQKNEQAGTIVITGMTVEEPEIHGRNHAAFSLSYFMSASLGANLSGFWRPVPFADPGVWRLSLAGTALHPRGAARLRNTASEDAIIDLCSGQRPRVPNENRGPNRYPGTVDTILEQTCPPPDSSWLLYECRMRVVGDSGVVKHQPLPASPIINGVIAGAAGGVASGRGRVAGLTPAASQGEPVPPSMASGAGLTQQEWDEFNLAIARAQNKQNDPKFPPSAAAVVNPAVPNDPPQQARTKFQQRTAPSVEVILFGRAMRICYPVQPPQLLKLGDAPCMPVQNPAAGDFWDQWLIGNTGVPIYAAEWQLRFATEGTVGLRGVGIVPSPVDGGMDTRRLHPYTPPGS